jgi:hypothetical protein
LEIQFPRLDCEPLPSRDSQDSSTPSLIVASAVRKNALRCRTSRTLIIRLNDPPQVTLSVRRHTVFGDTVAFCAPVSILPLWRSPVIDALIDRVDAARQKQ